MPTVDDLKTVYNLPPSTDDTYEEKKAVLLWYFDVYLPAAAGNDVYGPTVRYYKRSTKAIKVGGKVMPVITLQVEAFGLLVFENCLPKWTHICPKKAQDGGWSIPTRSKNKPENEKYWVTKWTDGKTGQIQGGGWTQDGYDEFSAYVKHVSEVRSKDKEHGWAVHELALQLMREEHGITETNLAAPKKRKRGGKVALAPLKEIGPSWEMPDVEDTFSVGSEVSSGERLPDDEAEEA